MHPIAAVVSVSQRLSPGVLTGHHPRTCKRAVEVSTRRARAIRASGGYNVIAAIQPNASSGRL